MQNTIWEVYDTRDGRRIAHCGLERDAIMLCKPGSFRAYREYPLKAVEPLTIDVDNLYNPQIMPAQQRLDPSAPPPLQIKANEQEPINFAD
jgi:hypothetical protein